MSQNRNIETNTKAVAGIYEFARYQLFAVAIDLAPSGTGGSTERLVSAWKLMPTSILSDRDHDNDEGWVLLEAVKKDLDEATALRGFGADVLDCHAEYDWYRYYIDLADVYGAEDWPTAALTDYLRGFEGMHELHARVTAALVWEKAKHLYNAQKTDDAKAQVPVMTPEEAAA